MMNSQLKTGVVLFLGAVVLAACGDKDGSSGVNLKDPKSVALTTISDTNAAAKAASSIFGADATVSESSNFLGIVAAAATGSGGVALRQVGEMKLPKIASLDAKASKALTLTQAALTNTALTRANAQIRATTQAMAGSNLRGLPTDGACDEGTMTISANEATGKFEITFNNCKEIDFNGAYEVTNGTVKMSVSETATSASGTITIGDGDASLESGDFVVTGYKADGTVIKVETISFTVTFSGTTNAAGTVASVTMGINGRAKDVDSVKNETSEVAFDDLSFAVKGSVEALDMAMASFDLTLNGAVEERFDLGSTALSPDSSQYLGFVNFAYAVTQTSTGTSETINGKIVSELSPVDCGHGSYQIVTTTPITRTKGKDLTGGEMTINTTTTITANADGSIHVVVNGTSADFADEKEMKKSLCL